MQRAKDITEIIKNLAQILAILIAGIWTYYLFGQREAPGLEPRADVNSSLSWQSIQNGSACEANFRVTFQNTGNSSFDVSKVHLRGWLFDKMMDSSVTVRFLNIDDIENFGEKIFDKTFEAKTDSKGTNIISPFIEHYPPNAAYNHTYQWEIKNSDAKWICFKIEFFMKGEDNQPKWITASWDRVCNMQDKDK